MKRALGLVLLAIFFSVSLGACACGKKEVKSEPPPPVVQKTPPPEPVAPAKPVPPPKKDRN